MNRKAGAGLQPALYERGQLLYQRNPDIVAQATISAWQVPAGNWWMIDLVGGILDTTGAAFNITYAVRAVNGGVQLFFVTGLFAFVGGAFAGQVLFARGIEPQDSSTENYLGGNLPEVWVPPETQITLDITAAGGSMELAQPVLIAHSTYNEPPS